MDFQQVRLRGPAMILELKKIMGFLFRESLVLGYSRPERESDPARTRTTSSVQGPFTLLELKLSSSSGFDKISPRTRLNRTLPSLTELQTY
jgi:hypothetical protein